MEESGSQTALEEEEENASNLFSLPKPGIAEWALPQSEDDDFEAHTYDVEEALNYIYNLPSCKLIMIRPEVQTVLDIVVGINVNQRFPWKQLKYEYIRDSLIDYVDKGPALYAAFQDFNPEDYVLIGYAPLLTQNSEHQTEADPFVIFFDSQDTKLALSVIHSIELYEDWIAHKHQIKKPKRWVSLGSENEINLTLQQRYIKPVDVEIQSVYPPTITKNKEFTFRKCADTRDGYVELIPPEGVKFDNVTRKRITIGIQSAPQLIDREQLTDPTFPNNMWTQYLYEIGEEDDLDVSSEDEEAKEKAQTSRPASPEVVVPKPPPEMSPQMKLLLSTLEFNQVDMYRNDYTLMQGDPVDVYITPELEEIFCFADIAKSQNRFVCSADWYPHLSGILAVSYTFSTACTSETIPKKYSSVKRAIMEPNPILLWSFSDNLNYKLQFDSPLEVTHLSFNPYDGNCLLGGAKNGQLILWDLQNRIDSLEDTVIMTTAQIRYQNIMAEYLKHTIDLNEEHRVMRAATSALEYSHTDAITGIYWMSRNFYINAYGKIFVDPMQSSSYNFFVTCSLDGGIAFWDFNAPPDKKVKRTIRANLPKALLKSESVHKNKKFKPTYKLNYKEPITGIVGDTSQFQLTVLDHRRLRRNKINYRIALTPKDPPEMRQTFIISTLYGHVEKINWVGVFNDTDEGERVSSVASFARVHDGPIVATKTNPFLTNIFVTVGTTVFAVWKAEFHTSPILWRKRPSDLTSAAWSTTRPSVLFITRADGNLEVWDILARDDEPCFNDIMGGGCVTYVIEHPPTEPEKLLGIGDYNSSFRMVKLPPGFYYAMEGEEDKFAEYIERQIERKIAMHAWEKKYYEENQDIIEAKKKAKMEALKEMERVEKQKLLDEQRRLVEEAEERRAQEAMIHESYPERMRKQWEELNFKRMLNILMSRKRMNAEKLRIETQLEKERLKYEADKKEKVKQALADCAEELANLRSRLLPTEKAHEGHFDSVKEGCEHILDVSDDYDTIAEQAKEELDSYETFEEMDYVQFMKRARQRRQLLNQSLGSPTDRMEWFEEAKANNTLRDVNFGYEWFINAQMELNERLAAEKHSSEPEPELTPSENYDDI
ncbi:dynein intermediate chain 3, axonemal-like [Teleopsis dalmanni]|uniref:dynein intermediate chain 3, axonemal-like n=1 Tax=Teleopsis dalmanni TaxID=139649 RepID=UPI000D329543|nr:dynein intermediate chain 3, axonemal-like [Teleopsis dalmanni]XP_037936951.1 dynein intermediate chain 3, axonemal-like [Teleopsis dalmanni]